MKRYCFSVFAVLAMAFGTAAQNPIHEEGRVYDVVTDTNSWYLFSMPKPCTEPMEQGGLGSHSILLQQYVTSDTVTVYGVAVTVHNGNGFATQDYFTDDFADFQAVISTPHGCFPYNNYGYNHIMRAEDTVVFNLAHPRFCWFLYRDSCDKEVTLQAPCYEMYFDTPDKINIMTDTFYVGYKWPCMEYLSGTFLPSVYGGLYDNSLPGTLYGHVDFPWLGDTAFINLDWHTEKLWGVAFPIVGFRCGPMEEYWVDSLAADSAVVRWRRVEQGTKFNVRLVGSDGSDTTYVTADTALALGGLSDTVLYNVMLRKQCRYATTNYDTTVYGTWLSTLTFGRDSNGGGPGGSPGGGTGGGDTTAGIGAAQIPTFDLVPNPARETVSVVLSGTTRSGRLSVLDMAGRELVSRRVEGPVEVLDVSALPAGVYLVRLAADTDVSTRRLSLLD